MSSKKLFIYKSIRLFEILNEIKDVLNYEVSYIDKNDLNTKDLNKHPNYLIITNEINENIENCLVLNDLPKKISEIVEKN